MNTTEEGIACAGSYHSITHQPSERQAEWAGMAWQLSSARVGFPLPAELGSVTGGSGGHLTTPGLDGVVQ